MSYTIFVEADSRICPFLRFSESKGFVNVSASGEDDEGEKKPARPQLSYLRVELDRLRPGMSDYIIRVATPEYEGLKSNTIISIRGNRNLSKYDQVKKLADVIGKEMAEREDATHSWEDLDTEHLADLLASCLKFFSATVNADKLQFTTEALM